MMRMVGVISAISSLASQAAFGDEIRHTAFASTFLGTWAQSKELCEARDKSNLVISEAEYRDSDMDCRVQVIVETAGALGANYSVRALCAASSDPSKTSIANLIIRPQSDDRISVGKAFDDLKKLSQLLLSDNRKHQSSGKAAHAGEQGKQLWRIRRKC